ncbi:inactive hydroxysteroid dehydrogenase-like protein 1 [Vespa mandarinia]|uniref:inactive hydroxysteroid dehydrogenase-like protein 1 n=1 Tax=Vespa mandarinia TaxID=7446 RepID=UPI00161274E8|nr:inactive hydroxysteroid dehydrogenase-like protein 1 [Vespa mandarinia]XP_035730057.1 inactive hydroxysteroid dehydrogenase-like protein 1 [Vespa mandarinia]XP_035730060.1 inactive hydroxysteroid dehydrogenase-like protein 1 [Vespa mandarinia]XP_035730061.1 inactive hydroxysteroid dehydrogenase-like protein 1 [Vespa mandarinia]XP_035730062.1 inactive hydroxysteroid dehydrogenase-like protein 1 [Vespa mandarinia]XP_035730063.1 inactive hydroxysteroid dehydrogenase-like protein 1 [Vespa manda
MMTLIILWSLGGLIALWLLFNFANHLISIIWEIFFPLINSKPINLRTKFGEWAVVTGSTDGIGKAYAMELATRNINLILISRSLDKLENTKSEILNVNPNIEVRIIQADFSKGKLIYEEIKPQLENVPIGILVNNVGKQYSYPMYLNEVPEDELWDIITINVGAATMMTRLIIEGMKKRRKGAIVNISSGSEHQPLPLMTVYAATKVYLKSFSNAIRIEYSKFGITVQHLSPFFINTKMNAFNPIFQVSSVFVPNPTTYAKNAIATLGKVDSSSGYWAHDIQTFISLITPVWIRAKIGWLMNKKFREDYIAYIKNK